VLTPILRREDPLHEKAEPADKVPGNAKANAHKKRSNEAADSASNEASESKAERHRNPLHWRQMNV
jgi:hypothetical protein